jgi:hypothetical protein
MHPGLVSETGLAVVVSMMTCNVRSARLPSSRIDALNLLLSLAKVRAV